MGDKDVTGCLGASAATERRNLEDDIDNVFVDRYESAHVLPTVGVAPRTADEGDMSTVLLVTSGRESCGVARWSVGS